MQVVFLLEEESAEAALKLLVPHLLPAGCVPRYRVFEGCKDLLGQLQPLLQGYRRRLAQPGQQDLRVVVLLDADGVGPRRLAEMEAKATAAGLLTYGQATAGQEFHVFNALAVQELEAWFLGDREAITAAYPAVRGQHFKGLSKDPDTITDTWERLQQLLQKAGYPAAKTKVKWAETITPHLDPARNESASFRYFVAGLRAL
ncbi:protein of unknown function [Hymenobacter daecheongensis DSM 21074]|uniref:DUF4276 family protein n=2 Tax=Hymenobacter daecheongensis TaxID=496053 RepID=A0A1M6HWL0_9BACT|nr:protein of unknown function [Hymenobacter daecheongensis DSM 21074]